MSTRPPVTRLVLYKHGVAFVERSGPLDGDFDLSLRRGDVNDVLKSLSITLGEGAGVGAGVSAVAFDTPTDPEEDLAERRLLLRSGEALGGLLHGLRGRAVQVHCGDQLHRGEVMGVDEDGESRRTLLLRTDSGTISLVDLAGAHGIDVLEDASREDLAYLMERSRAATSGGNRTVTVQFRGRAERARVTYIVPAPVWRVSYRVLRDGEQVVLAAMGIVHNPIDEDLAAVELTLTTGQPISFDIDLYHPRQAHREVVEERDRVVAPMAALGGPRTAYAMAQPPATLAYAEAADEVAAEDRGEYFEYRLTTPISLKRGGAAMVPLAVAPVADVRRELVWRGGEDPAPDIVLAFTNTTAVVLEEGPAVVYEQDSYAGEAMLDFTARGAKTRLTFAKDLAVRCRRTATLQTVTARVRLAADAVVEEQHQQQHHVLRAENDHDDPVEVVFELPRRPGHTVSPQDGIAEVTGSDDGRWHRFTVHVPGHQVVESSVLESWPVYREIDYEQLAPGELERWLADRALDAAAVDALSGVLRHWEHADRMDEQRQELDARRDEIHQAQSRIAEQLTVLGADGPEGELRRRQVGELDELHGRVSNLDAEIRGLRDEAAAARRAASEELRRVIGAIS